MKTKLIKIGNSQGVRIPKPIIEESGLKGEIELLLRDNEVVLRSVQEPRVGWDTSFKEMADNNDDELLDKKETERSNDWDETEWEW
ncbi:MAG: AbrB/MazE/SpoVT family DNA-binding domain-containing protein [Balneola sp.]